MQFIDLKAQYQALKDEIQAGIEQVLAHGQFIGGPEVAALEAQLSAFVGRAHTVSCASGTDALQLIFMAYGIGAGDAVFCPDVTFIASVEPAALLGATPVFCDIAMDTYTLCPDSLTHQIERVCDEGKLRPRAVVAVDLLGNPCDYEKLRTVCEKYDLLLIEDAAQAFGASYRRKPCGAFGEIAATSFFPAKPLGCYGDGGAVFTDDDRIAGLLRSLCVHGKGAQGKYSNERIGLNSRLDTLQAAILLPKLRALKEYEIAARQQVAKRYAETLGGSLVVPAVAPQTQSVYAQYAVLARDARQRDQIGARLKEKGIPTMVYYPKPQHLLPVFRDLPCYGEPFANATAYCERTLSLPMHPYLDEETQQTIICAVLEAL